MGEGWKGTGQMRRDGKDGKCKEREGREAWEE